MNLIQFWKNISEEFNERTDKWSVTYLSNNIHNELINLIGNIILSKIVVITKNAKYFSIFADFTPDVSHTEQLH